MSRLGTEPRRYSLVDPPPPLLLPLLLPHLLPLDAHQEVPEPQLLAAALGEEEEALRRPSGTGTRLGQQPEGPLEISLLPQPRAGKLESALPGGEGTATALSWT